MTRTDEAPTNGYKVNGHGHTWAPVTPVTPTVVGPAEPLTQPLPAINDQPKPVETAKSAPAPPTVSNPDPPVAPPQPEAPTPPQRPEFPLARLEPLGFGMTVLMAGTGQVLFFADWWGGTLAATLAALALAACFEVLMIGATDTSMKRLVAGERWRLLLVFGAFIATGATCLQLIHWAPTSPGMGVTFGLASFSGWAIHAITGYSKAKGYRERHKAYQDEVERLRRRAESYAEAAYERQLADWETQRQATTRSVTAVEPGARDKPEQKQKQTPARKPKQAKPKQGSGKPHPERSAVIAWARTNNAGYKKTASHFGLPPSTVRDWLAEANREGTQ